jgi:hypothetical protein
VLVQHPRSPLVGISWLLGVAGASAGCGAIGLVYGMFEAGLVPGVVGWLSGGWTVPFTIALSSAGIGAVTAALMTRSALRQGTIDSEGDQQVGGNTVAVPGVDSDAENRRNPLNRAEPTPRSPSNPTLGTHRIPRRARRRFLRSSDPLPHKRPAQRLPD